MSGALLLAQGFSFSDASPSLLITLSVIDIILLVVVLAIYLIWVASLLSRIASNLGEVSQSVQEIVGHADVIVPGLQHINKTLGIIDGALPLLYNLAERTSQVRSGVSRVR